MAASAPAAPQHEAPTILNPLPVPGDSVHMVDVDKVDKAWHKTGFRIPPAKHGENFKLDRAKAFIAELGEHDHFKAPALGINEHSMGFDDGRHRFAAMRDLGFKSAPVSMDPQSHAAAQALGWLA